MKRNKKNKNKDMNQENDFCAKRVFLLRHAKSKISFFQERLSGSENKKDFLGDYKSNLIFTP